MHIFDVLEAWLSSMAASLTAFGVVARFDRSPTDRPNPSFNLNLRRDDREVDVLIWESGEAEFVVGEVGGTVAQTHFGDVCNRTELAELLKKLTNFIVLSRFE